MEEVRAEERKVKQICEEEDGKTTCRSREMYSLKELVTVLPVHFESVSSCRLLLTLQLIISSENDATVIIMSRIRCEL